MLDLQPAVSGYYHTTFATLVLLEVGSIQAQVNTNI